MRVAAWPAFANRTNPYNALLYSPMGRMGAEVSEFSPLGSLLHRCDVIHAHWPDRFLNEPSWCKAAAKLLVLLLLFDLMRLRKTKLIWTVHNLSSHEGFHPRLEAWFWKAFLRRVDGYICLSEASKSLAGERFPGLSARPGAVIPHGHYRSVYPRDISRAEACRRLGIAPEARVAGFFGQIRPYKNVAQLINCFRSLQDEKLVLLVAGKPMNAQLERELRAEAAGDPRIHLHLDFVADQDVQLYLAASDLILLPYREILNSGSALLSLSFDRPVLVPAMGSMAELQDYVGSDWVRTYDGPFDAAVLSEAMAWACSAGRPAAAPLDRLDWEELAAATVRFYQEVACSHVGDA